MSAEPKRAYFISPKMTVEQAAREAAMRNYTLHVSWTNSHGMRVIAVPRETGARRQAE